MYFGRMYIFCCKVRKNLILYVTYLSTYSWIAQPVERVTVNHDVAGSNPASGANGLFVKWLRHRPFTAGSRVRISHRSPTYGRLAQLGERLPYKQNVGSSILSSPTKTARWCSGLTCRPVTAEIVSSNLIRVAKCGSSSVVEHNLAKVGVAGSSPVFRSIS